MRHHTLGDLSVPEDVWWADEFGWSPVEQAREYTVTGALVIDEAERLAGRPITLESAANAGWVTRALVEALRAQRTVPGLAVVLTLADERSFTVRHDLTREFVATPIRPAADLGAHSKYRIVLPLIEV